MGKMLAAALASGMLLLAGCASGPDVRAVSDPTANFAQFRTFGFADPLGTDRAGYQSIVSQQLKASTSRELTARGLTYSATNPDLLVNFSGKLNDKMRVTTTPEPVMATGYYGYRRGFYQPWPMYTERTDVTQYTEGTLTIDVIDAARKQLVWEGTVTKSISSKDQANVPAALDTAVAAAFAKYPTPGPAKN